MPDAANPTNTGYRFNPFDLTTVWPHRDYPLIPVGRMTLNRNPENFFAEIEQAAFSPGNTVPGIGLSPDKMLLGRSFAYNDALGHPTPDESWAVDGEMVRSAYELHSEDDDFSQPGMLVHRPRRRQARRGEGPRRLTSLPWTLRRHRRQPH